jgi:hypothetical protein
MLNWWYVVLCIGAWKSGTVMEIDMSGDIFSVGFTELLHLENIKEIVDHDWLSASVITLYARYCYYHQYSLILTYKLIFMLLCLGGNIINI